MSNQHKNPTISFRISEAERKQIEARILASGMMKKDYFVRSCIYNHICVVGKKETIYPLVETIYNLYQQLQVMQSAFLDRLLPNYQLPRKSQHSKQIMKICSKQSLICLMELNIFGKENVMNDFNFQFAMYNPITDTVEVNTGTGTALFIRCNDFNSTVMFDDPNDVVYLYHLAEEQPLTYAKFALSETGLQDYVDAMKKLN